MLASLFIRNYALIEDLQIDFSDGFTTITGETGAGKSILLGALSLVLGKRADTNTLRNKDAKCVVEAKFDLNSYDLKVFFEEEDLDYEPISIIRRELLPSGKSRAFVNDTPVTLEKLNNLGNTLVDIHSQHQTLLLTDSEFQLYFLDVVGGNQILLDEYQKDLKEWNEERKKLEQLKSEIALAIKDLDYNKFQLDELNKISLKEGMIQSLENEFAELDNLETIVEAISFTQNALQTEDIGILSQLAAITQQLSKIEAYHDKYKDLNSRVVSVQIELQDIGDSLNQVAENLEPDPNRYEQVHMTLNAINALMTKHQVQSEQELIQIKLSLKDKLEQAENSEFDLVELEKRVSLLKEKATEKALAMQKLRKITADKVATEIQRRLSFLGMDAAQFKITVDTRESLNNKGLDQVSFLLSANKGMDFAPLKKAASGGELSRIMLVIKAILASYKQMPTLIFDEIDTGVSGEISNNMAAMMKEMSHNMQVFAITHLPQVAAQGKQQLKVYKEETKQATRTALKNLNPEERIDELASMLGGRSYSSSAVSHAKELLGL